MLDQSKIWNSPSLPSLPTVAMELLELSKDAEAPVSKFAELIKTDPAICGRLLKATNSSYFAFSSKVASIDRAVSLLGRNVVTSLVLSFSLNDESIQGSEMSEFYQDFWLSSAVHATACDALAQLSNKENDNGYFVAGLMTDIGRLAMLNTISREYYPVLVAAREQDRPLSLLEQEMLGLTHAKVSEKIIDSWALPENLCQGIRDQHLDALDLITKYADPQFDLERAIVTASALGDYICNPPHKGEALQQVKQLMEAFYGYTMTDLQQFLVKLNDRIQKTGDLLTINTSELPEPRALMAEASMQLVELTMKISRESSQLAVEQAVIENEKKQLESQCSDLKQKADQDALTQIFNRGYFNRTVKEHVHQCQKNGQLVGLIFIDIDHFKALNDNYGHLFGDVVLKQVAKSLEDAVRKSDIVCRYGGEEFVILVPNPSIGGIQKLANRICNRIANAVIQEEGFDPTSVTISIGTAVLQPGRKDVDADQRLIQEADAAMYDSKENGRNQVHFRNLLTESQQKIYTATQDARFSRWLVKQEVIDMHQASRALLQSKTQHKKMGSIAWERELLSPEQVEELTQIQKTKNQRLGELALEREFLTLEQVGYILAQQIESPENLADTLVNLGSMTEKQARRLVEKYCNSYALKLNLPQFAK